MTSAPSSMPRLRPRATSIPSSGLLKATRRTKPKYTAIIAIVRDMAIRQRAEEIASSVAGLDMRGSRILEDPADHVLKQQSNAEAGDRPGVALGRNETRLTFQAFRQERPCRTNRQRASCHRGT